MKAIFFDFDGVLFDLEPIHYKAWVETLLKLERHDPLFSLDDVVGMSDQKIGEIFMQKFSLSLTPSQLYELKRAFYVKLLQKEMRDVSQEEALFQELRKNYLLAIVSSSHSEDIGIMLKSHHLESYFSFIVSGDRVRKHKPDPTPYLDALKLAKTTPDEVIAIEDSLAGVRSATSAGISTIWFDRFHRTKENSFLQQQKKCRDFRKLSEIIQSIDTTDGAL